MQGGGRRRAGGMDDFFGFGDPFSGFPGFANPRSLMSNFFSRDPFDDPFFNRPGFFGSDVFDDPFFTRPFGSMFGMADGSRSNRGTFPSAFIQDAPPQAPSLTRGPVIQELTSDGEDESGQHKDESRNLANVTNNGPVVQEPDDDADEQRRRASRCVRQRSEHNGGQRMQPQARSYSFQSSTVTYGGADGAYYTSSMTRRSGGDGVTEEEYKEADTTTGKATHRLSRGIRDKGHSVTRRLNCDGNVNTVQTLHNLNEDDLASFKEDWEGKASRHLPAWNRGFSALEHGNIGNGRQPAGSSSSRGWALPSNEQPIGADQRGATGKTPGRVAQTGSQPTPH
ncbi:unnamed protein product [Victoria cruziana]